MSLVILVWTLAYDDLVFLTRRLLGLVLHFLVSFLLFALVCQLRDAHAFEAVVNQLVYLLYNLVRQLLGF